MPTPDHMKTIRELAKAARTEQRKSTIFPLPRNDGDVFRKLLDRLQRAVEDYRRDQRTPGQGL